MVPLAWCPTVDSEQSSRACASRAWCADIDTPAVKNQFFVRVVGAQVAVGVGRGDMAQMDPQPSPTLSQPGIAPGAPIRPAIAARCRICGFDFVIVRYRYREI